MTFSNPAQLEEIAGILQGYLRLPFSRRVAGTVLEHTLAHVRGAEVLNTYDFVDVVDRSRGLGWQVTSTDEGTPVTWIRAKIPNKQTLIDASLKSEEGRQELGNAIIEFCNRHVVASLGRYDLQHLFYARLVHNPDDRYLYFERLISLDAESRLFVPADYYWRWSTPKQPKSATSKEQLRAFHGYAAATGAAVFAWHGLSENQLHFKGEREWWPSDNYPHQISFARPLNSIQIPELIDMLAAHEEEVER